MASVTSSLNFPLSLAIGIGLAFISIVFYVLSTKGDLKSEEDDAEQGMILIIPYLIQYHLLNFIIAVY